MGCEDVKAFFRRGKCYRHLGDVEKARKVGRFYGPLCAAAIVQDDMMMAAAEPWFL